MNTGTKIAAGAAGMAGLFGAAMLIGITGPDPAPAPAQPVGVITSKDGYTTDEPSICIALTDGSSTCVTVDRWLFASHGIGDTVTAADLDRSAA